jgi:hypothetical protein
MVILDFSHLGSDFPHYSTQFPLQGSDKFNSVFDLLQWACEQYNQHFSRDIHVEFIYLENPNGLELLNDQNIKNLTNGTYFLKMVLIPFRNLPLTFPLASRETWN